MVLLQRKLYFCKDPEGVQHFPGGGGGVQMLISIQTHATCDSPGGSRPPIPPSGSTHAQNTADMHSDSSLICQGFVQFLH